MLEGCKINVLNQMTQAMVICHAALHRNPSAFVNFINGLAPYSTFRTS